MTRRRASIGGAFVLALAVALVLGLGLRSDGEDTSGLRPLRVHSTLSDRIVVFGDTVRAQVDVAIDLRHVSPGAVKVRATFDPWRPVQPAQLTRSDAGSSSLLRVTYVLRCLKQICVPERDTLPFEFEPARVDFVNRAGGRGSVQAEWPRLIVHSRFQASDLATAEPWRLDDATVPEPSYRLSPGLLLTLLAAGSIVFLGGAGGLAYAGWPRRHVEPEPEPEPEPELLPTPLEQALELLEDAQRANGAADQRRSLELVAEVLGARGEEDDLARAARELAWSPTEPHAAQTKGLATRVRAALEEELRQLEEERRVEEERRRLAEEGHAPTE